MAILLAFNIAGAAAVRSILYAADGDCRATMHACVSLCRLNSCAVHVPPRVRDV
jgi:hypothetical protein